MADFEIITGDCLESLRGLPSESVHCCITSPPYWGLRDYGIEGQVGLEESPEQYVQKIVGVFREVRRVLRDDGTLWLNLGDSYAGSWGNYGGHNRGRGTQRQITVGSLVPNAAYDGLERWRPPASKKLAGIKEKDLIGIPWSVAFALRADGWFLRSDIIWAKPNPMPESVKDRCTRSHEYIFMFSKSRRYYYDSVAIAEDAVSTGVKTGSSKKKNKRDVWFVSPAQFEGAHFATYPPKLIEPCVLAGCPQGGTILDPFCGSGTTGIVALNHGRNFIGLELNPDYAEMSRNRILSETSPNTSFWTTQFPHPNIAVHELLVATCSCG